MSLEISPSSPLDYWHFLPDTSPIIQPAASVALEFQFYLLLPLLLQQRELKTLALVLSLAVFTLGAFDILPAY